MSRIEAFRKWLQPAPELRWDPWGPIAVGVLVILFVFAFGAKLGYDSADTVKREHWLGQAFMAKLHIEDQARGGIRSAFWNATLIDNVVKEWVKRQDAPASALARLRERLHRAVVHGSWTWARPDNEAAAVRSLAEFRVAHFSGSALAWKASAGYCDVFGGPHGELLVDRYEIAARAYSKLLGRAITAEQLAPAVPGGRCEGKEGQ